MVFLRLRGNLHALAEQLRGRLVETRLIGALTDEIEQPFAIGDAQFVGALGRHCFLRDELQEFVIPLQFAEHRFDILVPRSILQQPTQSPKQHRRVSHLDVRAKQQGNRLAIRRKLLKHLFGPFELAGVEQLDRQNPAGHWIARLALRKPFETRNELGRPLRLVRLFERFDRGFHVRFAEREMLFERLEGVDGTTGFQLNLRNVDENSFLQSRFTAREFFERRFRFGEFLRRPQRFGSLQMKGEPLPTQDPLIDRTEFVAVGMLDDLQDFCQRFRQQFERPPLVVEFNERFSNRQIPRGVAILQPRNIASLLKELQRFCLGAAGGEKNAAEIQPVGVLGIERHHAAAIVQRLIAPIELRGRQGGLLQCRQMRRMFRERLAKLLKSFRPAILAQPQHRDGETLVRVHTVFLSLRKGCGRFVALGVVGVRPHRLGRRQREDGEDQRSHATGSFDLQNGNEKRSTSFGYQLTSKTASGFDHDVGGLKVGIPTSAGFRSRLASTASLSN